MTLIFDGDKAIIKTDLFSKILWIGLFLLVFGAIFYLNIFVWKNLGKFFPSILLFVLFFCLIVPYQFLRIQIAYDKTLREWCITRPRFLLFFPIGYEEVKVRQKLVEIKANLPNISHLFWKRQAHPKLVFENGKEVTTMPSYYQVLDINAQLGLSVGKPEFEKIGKKFGIKATW